MEATLGNSALPFHGLLECLLLPTVDVKATDWLLRGRVLDGLGNLMPLSHEESSVSIALSTDIRLEGTY